MKPRILVLISAALTLGFGYWLAEASRDVREIWISLGAWILGFWFASSILGLRHDEARGSTPDEEDFDDDDDESEEEWE